MDKSKRIKIYIASSVGVDYFFFLGKTISYNGTVVEPIYLIQEKDYRKFAKVKGFKKIYLRVQMYIFYPIFLIAKALFSPKNSIFIISSNTFFAPAITKFALLWKKAKVYHLLYDLFPDAIEVAGSITQNGILSKLIGLLSIANFKYCDGTIYLGDFLKEHANNRWYKPKKSAVIHISTNLTLYDDETPKSDLQNKIIIHYGGQLGHLHDAESIIQSIKHFYQSDIKDRFEFNFYLSGAQANYLEKSLEGYPIKIISAVPSNVWRRDIKNYHIGLVTLSPGGASVCLPSKTYAMMAGGLSILAICPTWSDLSQLVITNNAGWVISNSPYSVRNKPTALQQISELRDSKEIALDFYNTLKQIESDVAKLQEKRINAFTCVRSKYNARTLNEKWIEFIS